MTPIEVYYAYPEVKLWLAQAAQWTQQVKKFDKCSKSGPNGTNLWDAK